MRMLPIRVLLLCVCAIAAHAGEDENTATPHVKVSMVTDVESVPAGDAFLAGIRFRLDPGWHIYWQHPGQAGLPTKVEWEGVDATVTPRVMPAPTMFREGEAALTTYGYANEVVLLADVRVAASAARSVDLVASVDFLVCEKECIPGQAALLRTLPVGPREPAADAVKASITASLARLPQPVTSSPRVQATRSVRGRALTSVLTLAPCANAGEPCAHLQLQQPLAQAFLPYALPWSEDLRAVTTENLPNGDLAVVLEGRTPKRVPVGESQIAGLLALVRADGSPWWVEIRAPVTVVEPPKVAPPPPPDDIPLLQVLLMALLGGMILNLMPCVFPVLALKVYAFATLTQQDRRHMALHAGAYTGGIVGSMVALAAAVIGLRAAGHSVGWGFQFQEPLFVSLVTGLIVAMALNMFGVFELLARTDGVAKAVDGSSGLSRSAGEGVLAVLLATPCSAPFLGTAVGFALARPPLVILAVFVALGIGLALPFVVLVMLPGVARLLPRPGPWMDHAKNALGFALLGTAIWLLWVLGQLTGVDGMARGLIFCGAIGVASWLWGKSQFSSVGTRGVVAVLNAALLGMARLFWALQIFLLSV